MTNVSEEFENQSTIGNYRSKNLSGGMKFLILCACGIGGVILLSLIILVISSILKLDVADIMKGLGGETQLEKNLLYLIVMLNSVLIFLIPSIVYFLIADKTFLQYLFSPLKSDSKTIILSIATFIFAPPAVMGIAWLNQKIPLPAWSNQAESDVNGIIDTLTKANSFSAKILVVILLGVLPGLSEEFFFRGALQRLLRSFFKFHWQPIVISAFLFSLMHFQFQGFLPRMALGILLGYAFYFSKSIWVPIGLHALFNGSQIIAMFASGKGMTDKIGTSISSPNILIILASCLLTLFAGKYLYSIRNKMNGQI